MSLRRALRLYGSKRCQRIFAQSQSVRTGVDIILQDNLSQWRAAILITPRSTTCAGHHSLPEERFVCPRESEEVEQSKVSLDSVKAWLFPESVTFSNAHTREWDTFYLWRHQTDLCPLRALLLLNITYLILVADGGMSRYCDIDAYRNRQSGSASRTVIIDIWSDMFQNTDREAALPHKESNGPIFQSLRGTKEWGNEARLWLASRVQY